VANSSRSGGLGREMAFVSPSAEATPPFRYVLDHPHTDVGHVEDLPTFGADDLGTFQAGPAPSADPGRWVTTSSGEVTWARCFPSEPGCLPARRPALAVRPRLVGFDNPSA